MGRRAIGLVAVVVTAIGVIRVSAQEPPSITVMRNGAPAANVQFDMQFLNQPKMAFGATNAAGSLDMTLEMANVVKGKRVQVVLYDCPNDRTFVVFVEAGAAVPEEPECRRRIAGWFWFSRARAVMIDISAGTLQVQGGQSFLASTRGRLIAGGGAAALGLGVLTAMGGDGDSPNNINSNNPGINPPGGSGTTPPPSVFDPSGNYPVANTVASDPGGHVSFIAMEGNTVLVVSVDGSTIRITCPPGSKWTLITGTFNPTSGQIIGEGRGPAAGFSNVLYRMTGTIAMTGSSQGQIAGQLTVGAGGEFPGGQGTIFTVAGRRQ